MQGLLSTLFTNPLLFIVIAVALVLSITIHEFSHAFVAHKLGDPTAKQLGRLTLNPLAHLDPIGTIVLLVAGFGWGKAVPINYYNLKNPRRDVALISLAGPGSNFILAALLIIVLKILGYIVYTNGSSATALIASIAGAFLYPTILYNVVLGIFNMLPIEPLDGFKIVNGVLPPKLSVQWMQTAPYGIVILILLVATRGLSKILNPALLFVSNLIDL